MAGATTKTSSTLTNDSVHSSDEKRNRSGRVSEFQTANAIALRSEAEQLLALAKRVLYEQGFEEGDVNPYRDALEAFIAETGDAGALQISILLPDQTPPIYAHSLTYLSRMPNADALQSLRGIALQALDDASPYVRDYAGLALVDLDDPSTLPQLKSAIEREQVLLLRKLLQQAYDFINRKTPPTV